MDTTADPSMPEGWPRPAVPEIDVRKDTIVFQQTDLDSYQSKPLKGMPGAQSGMVEVIRLFGVTDSGNSVLCHVHGFAPYLYTPAPPNFEDKHLQEFRTKLNIATKQQLGNYAKDCPEAVLGVEICSRGSLYGFHDNELRPFLKIYVLQHRFINSCKRVLEGGTLSTSLGCRAYEVYDLARSLGVVHSKRLPRPPRVVPLAHPVLPLAHPVLTPSGAPHALCEGTRATSSSTCAS